MKNLIQSIQEKLVFNKHTKEKRQYFVPKNKTEFVEYFNNQLQRANNVGTKDSPIDLSYIDFSMLAKNGNDEYLQYYFFDHEDKIQYLDMSYCKFDGMSSIDKLFIILYTI